MNFEVRPEAHARLVAHVSSAQTEACQHRSRSPAEEVSLLGYAKLNEYKPLLDLALRRLWIFLSCFEVKEHYTFQP